MKVPKSMVLLGTFPLGPRSVDVFADFLSTDGSFGGRAEGMKIGLQHDEFHKVVDIALHEAMEFACMDIRVRWAPAPDVSCAHDGYLFVLTHPEFGEACARAAEFLTPVVPRLQQLWKERRKRGFA